MISNVTIKNYKSVVDVSLSLGRFNLLIGANGCGKSNILEGIALSAAANSDKLEYEYFANRGIRVVEPRFMFPAFDDIDDDDIHISVTNVKKNGSVFDIHYNSEAKPPKWECTSSHPGQFVVQVDASSAKKRFPAKEISAALEKLMDEKKILPSTKMNISVRIKDSAIVTVSEDLGLDRFLIYSLEETKLRKADDSNRTTPLGLHGEGLFAYLKELAQRANGLKVIDEIKENLKVLDWFDDMEVPFGQLTMEFNLKLRDSYLAETINMFDQRSTNEGFLYLLFYLTLVISDETPSFFAIENIDTAFNPKLCREVIKRLVELAKKHDKQVIATTHNPAVLDGLDLRDEEQKLMVVQRSVDGYTKVRTLKKEQVINSDLPLSQLWLRGFIGGLPNNF